LQDNDVKPIGTHPLDNSHKYRCGSSCFSSQQLGLPIRGEQKGNLAALAKAG
jgi:hypothetical protein